MTANTPSGLMNHLAVSHAELANRCHARALERTALRMRVDSTAEVLARAASGGRLSLGELLAELEREPRSAFDLDSDRLLGLARCLAIHDARPLAASAALCVLDGLEPDRLEPDRREARDLLLGQLLLETGQHDRLGDLLDVAHMAKSERLALTADLLHPRGGGAATDRHVTLAAESVWLAALGEVLGGTASLCADGGAPEFDQLRLAAGEPVGGPLVSVVISTFRPGAELLTAVRSIAAQTWQDLEIVILDDGSGPEFSEQLDRAEAVDPRVRIVVNPDNRGTYARRNDAFSYALGEYITYQDDDDWSHPERLARQIAPFLSDPRTVCTLSDSLRVTDELFANDVGYPSTRQNTSSMMFRTGQVLRNVGYFDTVRKAADTEYLNRVVAACDERPVRIRERLAVVRRRAGSLSRGEFAPGWAHPRRRQYREAYGDWHAAIAAGQTSAFLFDDGDDRPFPAPERFLVSPPPTPSFDVVILADWASPHHRLAPLVNEVRTLHRTGRTVGLADLEALEHMSELPRTTARAARDLVTGHCARWLHLDDEAVVDTVVVRQPEVLWFPPVAPSSWTVRRVVVVADATGGAGSQMFAKADFDADATLVLVDNAVLDLFGVEPTLTTIDQLDGCLGIADT